MWKECKQIFLFSVMLGLLHNLYLFCAELGLDPDAPWTSRCIAGSKTTVERAGSPSRLCVSLFQKVEDL